MILSAPILALGIIVLGNLGQALALPGDFYAGADRPKLALPKLRAPIGAALLPWSGTVLISSCGLRASRRTL